MSIDYQGLIDEAMLGIVKKILEQTKKNGLNHDQCFYVSFITEHKDLILSRSVKEKYPKEITIVLQHQFSDLEIGENSFSVKLSFGGVPETIRVPLDALTSFVDPSDNFSLQFKAAQELLEDNEDEIDVVDLQNEIPNIESINHGKNSKKSKKTSGAKNSGEVISIDKFRKKN